MSRLLYVVPPPGQPAPADLPSTHSAWHSTAPGFSLHSQAVLHVRGLSHHITQEHLVTYFEQFAAVAAAVMLSANGQALVEMTSVAAAQSVVTYAQANLVCAAAPREPAPALLPSTHPHPPCRCSRMLPTAHAGRSAYICELLAQYQGQ